MKILYEFVTGETLEIEVPENVEEVVIEIEKTTKNTNRKETRRHNSLDYMSEIGIQFKDNNVEIEEDISEKELTKEVVQAINTLLPEQKLLIKKVFYKNMKIVDIAAEEGVSEAAIRNRLKKIYKKLKKVLL